MTVNQAIAELQVLSAAGFGAATIRTYSELHKTTYPEACFVLHKAEDNEGHYEEGYGSWVEADVAPEHDQRSA